MHQHAPELSIIVPVLNENKTLPGLLDSLAGQDGISFEVLLCDGGSTDGTALVFTRSARLCKYDVRWLDAPHGRACQMNRGAAAARGDILLFLHADSRMTAPEQLRRSVDFFRKQQVKTEASNIAGHFGIRFERSRTRAWLASLPYFYCEAKSRLNRAESVRGDQGCMITHAAFGSLGGFDESLPYLEDVRFAACVAERGKWVLLPGELITSARRFESEGVCKRQFLNALIINCAAAGRDELLTALPGLYRCHAETGVLQLSPLLCGIRQYLLELTPDGRAAFWSATGKHTAENVWQIFFGLDVLRAFVAGHSPTEVTTFLLNCYEKSLARPTKSGPAGTLAAVAAWLWFELLIAILRIRRVLTKTN